MATYHTTHSFQAGTERIWNRITRKHETRAGSYFCSVCGRKEDHMLHSSMIANYRAHESWRIQQQYKVK